MLDLQLDTEGTKLRGASYDLTDFALEGHSSIHSEKKQKNSKNSNQKSPEILSTTELISALGHIWNLVNPPAISDSEAKSYHIVNGFGRNVILDDLVVKYVGRYFSVDIKASSTIPSNQPKFELLSVTQKMLFSEPCSGNYTLLLFSRFVKGSAMLSNGFWKGKGFESVGISCELQRKYEWMKEMNPAELQCRDFVKIEEKKTNKTCILGSAVSQKEGCVSRDATHPGNNCSLRSEDCCSDSVESKDVLMSDSMKVEMQTGTIGTCCSDYKNVSVSMVPNSSLHTDYHMLAPHKITCGTFEHNTDDHKWMKTQENNLKSAFAGTFVSLCLHPVDTIKTVTQSCHAEKKSICNIGRSIVSERGVTGLYRGIASNIASSAPISAIYTFTYESVKGSLLPCFSKKHHSFAHCIAGGSASVATSFVFTPSELIKQQMQIGSHYHNCWNALIGIIGKGGLRSLYACWGAVLCRNVPHSIIKLVCGGLAGSTAALFTTPFDVVKTRLQIQIPGSTSQYSSVFHALKEIGKNEGLMGLYRGLIPRLIMYMSQGALFFASYEFFKTLFFLEVPQFIAQRIQYKESIDDDSTHLQWP